MPYWGPWTTECHMLLVKAEVPPFANKAQPSCVLCCSDHLPDGSVSLIKMP